MYTGNLCVQLSTSTSVLCTVPSSFMFFGQLYIVLHFTFLTFFTFYECTRRCTFDLRRYDCTSSLFGIFESTGTVPFIWNSTLYFHCFISLIM